MAHDMSKIPFVEVEWDDAQDHGGAWVEFSKIQEFADIPCRIVSRGWLVHKGKRYVVLSSDYIADDIELRKNPNADRILSRVTKIPRAWLVSIREIKIAKRRR